MRNIVNTAQVMAIKNPDTSACQVPVHSLPGRSDVFECGKLFQTRRNGQPKTGFSPHGFHLITQYGLSLSKCTEHSFCVDFSAPLWTQAAVFGGMNMG